MPERWTAGRLYAMIEALHPAPEWACFPEVANGTGSACRRHADALAMCLWPSRGLIVRGFEIKTSRSDYKNEAADPEKAETIAAYCDEWWIVTPPKLLDVAQIPPAWGLMEPDGGRLVTIRAAVATPAQPLSRAFVAALARASHKWMDASRQGWIRVEDIEERIKQAEERGLARAPRQLDILRSENAELQKCVADFKTGTGIDLMQWRHSVADEIASYVRVGQVVAKKYGGVGRIKDGLEAVQRGIETMMKELTEIDVINAGKREN